MGLTFSSLTPELTVDAPAGAAASGLPFLPLPEPLLAPLPALLLVGACESNLSGNEQLQLRKRGEVRQANWLTYLSCCSRDVNNT